MTIILVHGAWHGAWCWARITPLLERDGHRVLAPDLAGCGADRTALSSLRFDDWTRGIIACLREAGGRSMLVGHSRGGAVISSVAEQAPELVDRLVYLAAYLLRSGQSVQDVAMADPESVLLGHVVPDAASGGLVVRDEGVRAAFYGECDDAEIALARARLRPEPRFGLATRVHVTEAGFGAVARYYIECTRDRTISLACQRRMQAALPCQGIISLEADHSPFLSAPALLVSALADLADRSIFMAE